jgi:hypothetical protein
MSADDDVADAEQNVPPIEAGYTETATVAGAASAGIATGAATNPGWYSFACNAAFMIVFGETAGAITNPTDSGVLPAGEHRFFLKKRDAFFKATAKSNGHLTHWKSGEANRKRS